MEPIEFTDDTLRPPKLRRFEGEHLRIKLRRARRWIKQNGPRKVKEAPRHIRDGLMCLAKHNERKRKEQTDDGPDGRQRPLPG